MKLGEKLQQLRKKSGLSQEQLATQLTVSRQAVSKWELSEAMPDTENVIQLSRIFGVSCDYLLRDEVNEQGAALPVPDAPQPVPPGDRHSPSANDRPGGLRPPGETHLNEQGWIHNAFSLSLFLCAIGLLLALGGWLNHQTTDPLIIGLIVQVSSVMLFELAVPRMGGSRKIARLTFYMVANWLLMPIPMAGLCWWIFDYAVRPYHSLLTWAVFLSCDLMFSGAVTAVLAWLRWRSTRKK